MSPATSRDEAIWCVIAIASSSFALGILFIVALQRLMVRDDVFATLLLFLLPLCALGIAINTRRILKAIA